MRSFLTRKQQLTLDVMGATYWESKVTTAIIDVKEVDMHTHKILKI